MPGYSREAIRRASSKMRKPLNMQGQGQFPRNPGMVPRGRGRGTASGSHRGPLQRQQGNFNQGPPQGPPIIPGVKPEPRPMGPPGHGHGNSPPIIPREGVAPGEHPPGEPLPDGNPSGNPDPRPGPTLGMRRLDMLRDKNRGNDRKGLEVAMRLLGRAQQGQGFGGKVFRENMNQGGGVTDLMDALKPYLKGTPYNRMFRQATGMPVRPRQPKPRPLPGQGPYIPRDNNTHYVR